MVVEDGFVMLAGAALPCMLLVLGAILCRGPGQSDLRVHVIIGVVVAKLMLVPILGEASSVHYLSCAPHFTPLQVCAFCFGGQLGSCSYLLSSPSRPINLSTGPVTMGQLHILIKPNRLLRCS